MAIADKILRLTKQLYPTGRAFQMPKDGDFEKLHIALNASEVRAYNDAVAIHNSILPDTANFTADDATDWERRLGLISDPLVALADRKLAIKRKLNAPGANPAKGHYLYVQSQLRDAGFDVYVFENRFDDYPAGYYTQSPVELTGDDSYLTAVQHGQIQHGEAQHGYTYNNKVVNHIDENLDLPFAVGENLRSTFFIGGTPIGTIATVDENRKAEFRQLILKLKPVQTVAFLLINYT